ncbi:G-type lectin S-receptor-like serine/threonine-protein kinase SD2-5 [Typha latifolia]|uniref:G-type lectin S-receptor-like serine/threonine-protein kinase SD2-5 n=1 Tax=Typha latifolia TaxID=4733 RepID=UPI003C2B7CCC
MPPPLFFFFFFFFFPTLHSQPFDYPIANLSTLWTNDPSLPHHVSYPDGSSIRAILLRLNPSGFGPSFAAGFFCTSPCASFFFAAFVVYANSGGRITNPTLAIPQVVWSANRHRPVQENATLHFTPNGDLVLKDLDGGLVWSTNTSSRNVVSMSVSESGNLVLVDRNNLAVWQSFEHPTDALVLGQSLSQGMRLTANTSSTNWTESDLYLTVLSDGLHAFVDSSPPQLYFQTGISGTKAENRSTYVSFLNGSLAIFALFLQPGEPDMVISLPPADSVQYMRLESDGHLRLYEWRTDWKMVMDVLNVFPDNCAYPTVCGQYGICSNGQCSCPSAEYFRPVNDRQANLGCAAVTSISCQSIQGHQLLALDNVSYFNYIDLDAALPQGISETSCKQACLNNCSCKAALFQYGGNVSHGSCFLPSQIFSLQTNRPEVTHYNSSAFIKVQVIPSTSSLRNSTTEKGAGVGVVVGSSLGAFLVLLSIVALVLVFVRRRSREASEEDFLDQVPGMPTRFTFEELRVATWEFSTKLGEGGFGSVFEGKIGDDRIAVKRLDGIGQGKKEFLAEVETIGSVHHFNLVRLIGFCADRSHRLLVYEYMCNGSLDKWIYYRDENVPLDWQTRHKIMTDIAKGLSYLHEECRQRIAHLDIKPQNILLDDKFTAKVSDFGLSKLIDRDQSHVMTRMRGTPGYLAPEWLTSIITEKVDIYSFGVVVMEIVCGRKNLDHSQPEGGVHLISLLQDKAKIGRLLDLVDHHSNDMQLHENEAIRIIKLAMWCLQIDSSRRPSMSMVVKVLEGAMDVETSIDYNFVITTPGITSKAGYLDDSPPPSASLLSGPR